MITRIEGDRRTMKKDDRHVTVGSQADVDSDPPLTIKLNQRPNVEVLAQKAVANNR